MRHSHPRLLLSVTISALLASACAKPSETGASPGAPTPRPALDATVSGEDVQRNPNVPIEQILQGKIAGVNVSRAEDGGLAVRIRGSSSLTGNNEPLYVLDGVPIQPGPGGSLVGINPYDIASIKVLKDPAELTMYGLRGANGVIVIKTKRAPKPAP